MKIYFLSPVPPHKTGTADYISDLLITANDNLYSNKIVIVSDFEKGAPQHSSINNFPIINYKNFRPKSEDLIFVFLANNHFHDFCFHFILKSKNLRICTIFHDIQLFMAYSNLCGNKFFEFNNNNMYDAINYEHESCSDVLFDSYIRQNLPEITKYGLMCNHLALEKSFAIIVHSHYAKIRLNIETPAGYLPKIFVAEHPHLPEAEFNKSNEIRGNDCFTIGCFGWISSSKRPIQIVRAFNEFLNICAHDEKKQIKLKFVGQLAERSINPIAEAERLSIQKYVEHTGYIKKNLFLREIQNCSLIINLRFPSCGETSGTLSNGRDINKPTVVTRYQSFAEESSAYYSSFLQSDERRDLVTAMKTEFENWKNKKKNSEPVYNGHRRQKTPIADVMATIIKEIK